MKSSIIIKIVLSYILFFFGFVLLRLKVKAKDSAVILMYHRICHRQKDEFVQAGMYVEPETFKKHLIFLKKFFKLVSLNELILQKDNILNCSKPLCALTFDDGWQDFYQNAFPLLKQYDVPATVFLPTDFIGTKKLFWTDRLAYLLWHREDNHTVKSDSLFIDTIIKELGNLKGPFESQIEAAIQRLKACRIDEVEAILSELARRRGIDTVLQRRAFLSWEEVREMADSGLVSYGSHTAGHSILPVLNDSEIYDELKKSMERLVYENVVDQSSIPFCYPNGNNNDNLTKMVKACGYNMAVTTKNGWNQLRPDNLFVLNRVGIHQDISSTIPMFGCTIINCFSVLRDLFNKKL